MIVACPSCATRFRLPDGAIGEGGRQVRCSACQRVWRASAGDPPPPPSDAPTRLMVALPPGLTTPSQPAGSPVAASGPSATPSSAAVPEARLPRLPQAPSVPPSGSVLHDHGAGAGGRHEPGPGQPAPVAVRRRATRSRWRLPLLLVLGLLAAGLVLVTARGRLAAAVPAAAPLAAWIDRLVAGAGWSGTGGGEAGAGSALPFAALVVRDVDAVRAPRELTVTGTLHNTGTIPITLPGLLVTLERGDHRPVRAMVHRLKERDLPGAASLAFAITVPDPPEGVTGWRVDVFEGPGRRDRGG